MKPNFIRLKKGEDRRIRAGHPWIFSNEIDNKLTPLKSFSPGQEVIIEAHDKSPLGKAYINPHSLIAARVFSRHSDCTFDQDFLLEKLQIALHARKAFFAKPFYRLIFSEADGLPGLIIDRFNDILVVQLNTAGMESHKALTLDTLRALLPETKGILLKNDSPIRHMEGLETYIEAAFGDIPDIIQLEENHVLFHASLLTGQKTGWFYDHRLNRARLKDYVQGRHVLDVFSYLGGFGIQAAVFGAESVSCVDSSASACDMIKQNAALNHVADKVRIIGGDAFETMKTFIQENTHYDVIILDPPAFVKKLKDKKEGIIAYQRLNEMALKLLKPNGVLFSCSCSMHVSMEELTSLIQRAAIRAQSVIQILERGHQGPDHPVHPALPETDYLKTIIVRKLAIAE